jgi:hypothetical protein
MTFFVPESEISRFATTGTWCVAHRQVRGWLARLFDSMALAEPQDDRSPWVLGAEEMQPRIRARSAAHSNFQLANIAARHRLMVEEG